MVEHTAPPAERDPTPGRKGHFPGGGGESRRKSRNGRKPRGTVVVERGGE